VYLRWTGLGCLVVVVWMAVLGLGIAAAVVLFGGDGKSPPIGLAAAGAIAGMVVGAALVRLLGLALNRRRRANGTWAWTDRHTMFNVAVQDYWAHLLFGALLAAPCVTAGFIPKAATQGLVAGWVILVIIAAVFVVTRDGRRQARARRDRTRGADTGR
jgi:hypothetical protein